MKGAIIGHKDCILEWKSLTQPSNSYFSMCNCVCTKTMTFIWRCYSSQETWRFVQQVSVWTRWFSNWEMEAWMNWNNCNEYHVLRVSNEVESVVRSHNCSGWPLVTEHSKYEVSGFYEILWRIWIEINVMRSCCWATREITWWSYSGSFMKSTTYLGEMSEVVEEEGRDEVVKKEERWMVGDW